MSIARLDAVLDEKLNPLVPVPSCVFKLVEGHKSLLIETVGNNDGKIDNV
jgi:hypothetical protein